MTWLCSISSFELSDKDTRTIYNENTQIVLEETLDSNSNALYLILSSKEIWYHVEIWFKSRSSSWRNPHNAKYSPIMQKNSEKGKINT